jgi:hypothetical protein
MNMRGEKNLSSNFLVSQESLTKLSQETLTKNHLHATQQANIWRQGAEYGNKSLCNNA